MLVNSIYSFFQNVFFPLPDNVIISATVNISSAQNFNSELSKIFFIGKDLIAIGKLVHFSPVFKVKCTFCHGHGHKTVYRNGEHEHERCHFCHGDGRRRLVITVFNHIPHYQVFQA